MTIGWQRPARHRRESGATCSRVTILTGGRDLVDMGNNGAFACTRAGSSLWVSFPIDFACISVHCRVPCVAHNGLVYFGAAARPSFEQCGPERAACIRTGRFSILLFVESGFRTGHPSRLLRSIFLALEWFVITFLMILLRKI